MQVHTGYRYRLEPSGEQCRLLAGYGGACRWVWNEALGLREAAWLAARSAGGRPEAKALGYVALAARLTHLRRDLPWLAEAPIHPLQQTLRDLDQAFAKFFKGQAGHPRFKAKGREALRFPDPKQFGLEGEWLKLPKLGRVRIRLSRPLPEGASIRHITVSRDGGHWYAALCVEHEIAVPAAPGGAAVGLDVGITQSVTLSTGEVCALPVPDAAERAATARMGRQVARKKKGSARWRKAVARLAKRQRHLADRRRDAAHKLTTRLARSHPLVVVEDLKLRAMTGSAKGSAEKPGKNVAQKSGLNRNLLAQAHGELRQMLAYKTPRHGGRLVAVPAHHTSQRCAACGHVAAENRPTQAGFRCVACGHADHADHNAACNILAAGLAVPAHGGIGPKAPVDLRTHRSEAA